MEENLTPLQDEYYMRLLHKQDFGKAKNIAYDILADMTSRNGLENEWEQIDYDVQEEIIQKWIDIAQSNCA